MNSPMTSPKDPKLLLRCTECKQMISSKTEARNHSARVHGSTGMTYDVMVTPPISSNRLGISVLPNTARYVPMTEPQPSNRKDAYLICPDCGRPQHPWESSCPTTNSGKGLEQQLTELPAGLYIGANRYDTDNEVKLHLWDGDGNSFDLVIPKGDQPDE